MCILVGFLPGKSCSFLWTLFVRYSKVCKLFNYSRRLMIRAWKAYWKDRKPWGPLTPKENAYWFHIHVKKSCRLLLTFYATKITTESSSVAHRTQGYVACWNMSLLQYLPANHSNRLPESWAMKTWDFAQQPCCQRPSSKGGGGVSMC